MDDVHAGYNRALETCDRAGARMQASQTTGEVGDQDDAF
jgi:hypothetical protein